RYYCILDVEATCAENDRTLPNEVIEFPVILLDARTLTRVAEFRSFVRPRLSRTLSSFCTSLTGIRQEQVDAAASFPVVLKRFRAFLKAHGVGPNNMRFITDGPCDIRDFVTTSCRAHGIPVPRIFRGYVNVRKLAQRIYGGKGATINFKGMMRLFGLELEGRQHSGIDDARNITRAVIRMMEDG
ncbi:putative prion interactor pint1, partial [Chytriomyces sp. MP71]